MRELECAGDAHGVAIRLRVGPEQLDLQPLSRERRTIDCHKWPRGTLRRLVDQPGDRLLATAGGPLDQHAAAGGRSLLDLSADLARGDRLAEERDVAAGETPQARVLAAQPVRLDRPLDDQQEAVGLEWLLDEIVGAGLDRGHRRVDRAVAGDHHHRDRRLFAPDHVQQLQSV